MKTSYEYAKSLKKCANVLIPDGVDGWHVFPFTSYGHKVTTYEPEQHFIQGGEVLERDKVIKIDGLKARIKVYDMQEKITYYQKNFFEEKETGKYDFVYVVQSLSRECNAHISLKDKIQSLQKAVVSDGYIYIYYYLAIIDDEKKYPLNQYPRDGMVASYFQTDEWEILYQKDRKKIRLQQPHFGNDKKHYHKVGYIYARKVDKQIDRKLTYHYHFNLNLNKD